MLERIHVGNHIAVDTCHVIELRKPDYFKRVQDQGIFKGAVVHVCVPVLNEALDKGESFEAICARHKQLGAAKTVPGDLTPEMNADAVVMERRHEGLHYPDNYILAYAKYTKYVLCTRDGPLVAAARAEGVERINPDKTYGSAGRLYEHRVADRPGLMPSRPGGCPVAPTGKSRRRLPRRACPNPSDPRFRQVPGRPA